MRTFITRINGFCDPVLKEKQEKVSSSAYSLGWMDMAIYVYNNSSESNEHRSSRFDGIIAGISSGDIVVLQLPTGNGYIWEKAFVSKIQSYGGKVVFWMHNTELDTDDWNDSIFDYISLCSSQKTIIVNSMEARNVMYDHGLNRDTVVLVCEKPTEKIKLEYFIRKALCIASENINHYDSIYKMIDRETIRTEKINSFIRAIARKTEDNGHLISVVCECDADGYLVYSDNSLIIEKESSSFFEVSISSEQVSKNYVVKAFVYTLTGKRIVASAEVLFSENNSLLDLCKYVNWDDVEQIRKIYSNINLNIENAYEYLMNYDLVSFDIFDTLITRNIYRPDDIFNLMGRMIKSREGIDVDFLSLRKRAESKATQENGAKCSIYDIYNALPSISEISVDQAKKWMELEINMEYDLCIPRKDMLVLFDRLKKLGKKIVLVSDMYLTSKEITKMLEKCGYKGFDEIIISCENGYRKDTGSMWKYFFDRFGNEKTIHVGDNIHSDIKLVRRLGKDVLYVRSPLAIFEQCSNNSKLIQCTNNCIENSVLLGMIVNGYIYNSPFNIDYDGLKKLVSPYEIGAIAFGSLFAHFIKWIQDNAPQEHSLLFLAREGFLLHQLYQKYCDMFDMKADRGIYFLASRRAASVAAMRDVNDLEEILASQYNGTLEGLLRCRLGFSREEDIIDCNVAMPKDLEKVMKIIEPYQDEIIRDAILEKESYLKYIDELKIIKDKATVVDVGYSGTIQYFLAKLLDKKVDGCYLVMGNNHKPEALGCDCQSIFSLSEFNFSTLFLESALKAPYGQLVKFYEENGRVQAVYDEDSNVDSWTENIQKGILDFTVKCWEIYKKYIPNYKLDRDFSLSVTEDALGGKWFSMSEEASFAVQDNYCSNGELVFKGDSNGWYVVR